MPVQQDHHVLCNASTCDFNTYLWTLTSSADLYPSFSKIIYILWQRLLYFKSEDCTAEV